MSGHALDVNTAKFFPSGVVILSGGSDTQLKVWSAETGQCAATMIGHKAGMCALQRRSLVKIELEDRYLGIIMTAKTPII